MTRRNILSTGVAIVVAILGAAVAPSDWDSGEGSVRLQFRDSEVVSGSLVLGDKTPIDLTDNGSRLMFAGGVPVDDAITAVIRGVPATESDIGDFELTLTLPDGRVESVPVISFEDEEDGFVAQRRPPRSTAIVLGLLGFVLVAWVTEMLPIFVTSLVIPVVLVVGGVVGPSTPRRRSFTRSSSCSSPGSSWPKP